MIATTRPIPVPNVPNRVWCPQHGTAGWSATFVCPFCASGTGAVSVVSMPFYSPVAALPSKPSVPAGRQHEDAMAAALEAAHFPVVTFGAFIESLEPNTPAYFPFVVVREFPWGECLTPRRGFRSDFAVPRARLLVEIEGQVHSIKGKRRGDVLRRQLAEGAGFRVLSILPEQVGPEAVALVRGVLTTPRVEVQVAAVAAGEA